MKDRIQSGERLGVNKYIQSPNGKFRAIYQGDGNFVIYQRSLPIWHTNTAGKKAGFLTLQHDGNLVLYHPDGKPYWANHKDGIGKSYLQMQNDANLVQYSGGKPVWASNSKARPEEPVKYRTIDGGLTIRGKTIADKNGPILPVCVHFGDGRALFGVDEQKVRGIFESFVENQYQGFLSWSVLNNSDSSNPWHIPPYYYLGPKVQDDYYTDSVKFAKLAREHNLIWIWSMGGLDSFRDWNDVREFVKKGFIDVAKEVGPEWFVFEFCNELHASSPSQWHNPEEVDKICDMVRETFPNMIVMTTSVRGTEDPEELAPYNKKTKILSHHAFRKLYIGNKADHPWTFGYETMPKIRAMTGNSGLVRAWNLEGCGPFSDVDAYYGEGKVKGYVSAQDHGFRGDHQFDDESMGLIATKCYAGGLAYNYFCATGVKYNRPFTDYPGYANIGKLVHMFPQDIWNYEWLGHGGDNRPWSHMRFIPAVRDSRVDGFYSNDGKGFVTISGVNNIHDRSWSFPVLRDFHGKIIHPGTREVNEVSRKKGEELNLSFKWGRILII